MNDWNEADAVSLRDYLETESGRKLIYEQLTRPSASGSTVEEVALSAKHADGIEDTVKKILRLSQFRTPAKNYDSGNIDLLEKD